MVSKEYLKGLKEQQDKSWEEGKEQRPFPPSTSSNLLSEIGICAKATPNPNIELNISTTLLN